MTLASFGTAMAPAPNGHTPASARNKVDFPAPDGPVTNTRSPSLIERLLALTSGTPFGSRTLISLKLTSAASPASIVIDGFAWAAARAAATDRSKPDKRSTTERHSAR